MSTLTDVIAGHEWLNGLGKCLCGWEAELADHLDRHDPEAIDQHHAHVADAIRTHLTSDPVIDRMWDAFDDHGHNGIDCRPRPGIDLTIRAALAAALNTNHTTNGEN